MSKYGNKWTEYKGDRYQSLAEGRYAKSLDLMMRAVHSRDKVARWERQVAFPIVVNGIAICKYIADFRVFYADGRVEVVDVKGVRTDVFKLKKKLLLAVHGIDIVEVKC